MKFIKNLLYRTKKIFKPTGKKVFVLLLGLTMYSVINLHSGFKQMVTLATSVKPELFTELYFENHRNLPHVIQPNHHYSFAFTIHNAEQHDLIYNYEIILKGMKKPQMLSKHKIFVRSNDYRTITTSFAVPPQAGQSAIIVALANKNQQIDFLINE